MLRSGQISDYIAVDWGTTNRRAYRLSDGGRVADSFEDALGVHSVNKGGFDRAVAEIRERLGDLPMLLAGAVGSNRGWREVPYIACSAGPAEIAAAISWVDEDTAIVPGVSQRTEPDVMRGEEVQAIGAIALGQASPDGLICSPGTHAKWIMMAGGGIENFYTAMTGEIFGLLKKHSILSDLLQNNVTHGPAFDAGVSDALQHRPLLSALFAIRARHLLDTNQSDHASYASGLLIGTDVVTAMERHRAAPVSIVGQPDLIALYARAVSLAGRDVVTIDGGQAFTAGITAISVHIK